MKFKFNQPVLHGRTRYEANTEVPLLFAHYFAANGWIDALDNEAEDFIAELRGDAPASTTLNIQSPVLGQSSEVVS